MKVCPRCWKTYPSNQKECRMCHRPLVDETEVGESKVDPHFKIIKDKHIIRSKAHDHVTHQILNFDEKKHHEHHSGAWFEIPSQVWNRFFKAIFLPLLIFGIFLVIAFIGALFIFGNR